MRCIRSVRKSWLPGNAKTRLILIFDGDDRDGASFFICEFPLYVFLRQYRGNSLSSPALPPLPKREMSSVAVCHIHFLVILIVRCMGVHLINAITTCTLCIQVVCGTVPLHRCSAGVLIIYFERT